MSESVTNLPYIQSVMAHIHTNQFELCGYKYDTSHYIQSQLVVVTLKRYAILSLDPSPMPPDPSPISTPALGRSIPDPNVSSVDPPPSRLLSSSSSEAHYPLFYCFIIISLHGQAFGCRMRPLSAAQPPSWSLSSYCHTLSSLLEPPLDPSRYLA